METSLARFQLPYKCMRGLNGLFTGVSVLLLLPDVLNLVMASVSNELLEGMFKAAMECEVRKLEPVPQFDGPYCNITFDNFACWGYAAANSTTQQPCPHYIMMVPEHAKDQIDDYAYKRCDENGEWQTMYNPEGELFEWTNYTQCAPPQEELVTHGRPLQDLQIIYTIGYSVSLVALVAAMVIFLYFRKLRCPRNTIHMHLFMSFILRAIFVFIRDKVQAENEAQKMRHIELDSSLEGGISDISLGTPGCKAAFSLIQYFLVANFYWLLVEGVYLHSLITMSIFSERSNLLGYILLGWGCPVLVVIPWTIIQSQLNKGGCWWENVTSDRFYWIIKGPVMFSIVINFFLFLNIMRVIFTKLRASNAAEAHQYSKMAKSTLVLIPLFGVYYIISVGLYTSNEPIVVKIRMYFELTLSPIQGFLVALLYCFMNGEVRTEIKRKWRVRQLNNNLSNHRSVRNGHSSSFSGATCNEIREPLRGGRQGTNRTPSSVKERLLALKKNAFRSNNSANGHVPLGNGSAAGKRFPGVSQTDMTDNSPTPSPTNVCTKPEEAVDVLINTRCVDVDAGDVTMSSCGDNKTSSANTPNIRVAPLINNIDELSRIADSQQDISGKELFVEGCLEQAEPAADSNDDDGIGPESGFLAGSNGQEDDKSPPQYEDLFPKGKSSSSLSNIETQV